MKKITLLSLTLVFITLFSHAQISKGSTFIGGFLNFSSDKNKPTSTTNVESTNSSWEFRPQLGKVIRDNKVAGVFLNAGGSINRQSSLPSNLSQTKNSFYGGGVFFRNYFAIANRFYLFGDASIGLTPRKSESLNDNGTSRFVSYNSKTIESNLSLTPGISFAASKKIHLEAAFNNLFFVSYSSTKSKEYSSPATLYRETKNKNWRATANANGFSSLFLGVRFILP